MASKSEKFIGEGLTYDDVLLVPAYSQVLPRDTNIMSQFSRNIVINTPVVSAAMDTVTESAMAIAMAQEGGIGVLHKNMSIERQAAEVRKVKRSESGMIHDPITLNEDANIGEALQIMKDHKIGGIPIVDQNRRLKGILTNRDLRFETNLKRKVTEIMTKDRLVTSTGQTSLEKAEEILRKYKIEKLPVVDKKGSLMGLITYKDIIKFKSRPNSCKDSLGRLRVAAAVGITANMIDRVEALVATGVDAIVLDTAHGHSKGVIEALKLLKKTFKHIDVVCGNVGTAEGALALAKAGADAVKVGIGPGSICTTRVVAGVGVPQLWAVYQTAKALQKLNVPVIADGGVRFTGDIPKAIAAGAACIMSGSLFAGVDESPGETIIFEGRKYKSYRGMGSIEAMKEGSKDRYFQDAEDDIKKLVPEGIVGRVPYKGTVAEVMYQLIGGLRASMGYCGASTIKELKKAQMIKITSSGVRESHPHSVTVVKEAPNYSLSH
ncbi:MAG TPA: IMP dehydrogenase [Bacteroidia bacterium]|nr:IMP dehydrogenase [Bacteroidia bacterium]HNT79630.1 IMP dehydrogenase [Bacteroidia bacterium]